MWSKSVYLLFLVCQVYCADLEAPESFNVLFTTTVNGGSNFTVEVQREWSPNGVDRFWSLLQPDTKFYDNNGLFRVVPGFVVQWGINGNPAVTAEWSTPISDDPVIKSNLRGWISYAATSQPDSRTTQLFINYQDNSGLDSSGFTPFAQVTSGMDVVDAIYAGYEQEPNQGLIKAEGNSYLEEKFPLLDYIITARILTEEEDQGANTNTSTTLCQCWWETTCFALLCLQVSGALLDSCVAPIMPGFDPNVFYSYPEEVQLATCTSFDQNTCCSLEYSEVIANLSDPISTSFKKVIPVPLASCRAKLQDISCIMCSPDQENWIMVDLETQSSTLTMCQTYCDDLYNNCAGTMTMDLVSVKKQYNTSNEFCGDLFSNIYNSSYSLELEIVNGSNCWRNLLDCTINDFHSNFTECKDAKRNLIWNLNSDSDCQREDLVRPNNIYNIPCGALTTDPGEHCGVGLYFDVFNHSCMRAPPGYFSIGNGFKIDSWLDLPKYFFTDGWIGAETEIRSGAGNTFLLLTLETVMQGSIQFKYISNNYGDPTSGFSVLLDGQAVDVPSCTNSQLYTHEIPLDVGTHTIQFYFDGGYLGRSYADTRGVQITEIFVLGSSHTALEPIPCPPGTYSSEEGSKECITCDWNTYSGLAATSCSTCHESEYSLPGASYCSIRDPCDESDYKRLYLPCEDGKQIETRKQMNPLCLSTLFANFSEPIDCFPCDGGSYREPGADICARCPVGKYWSNSDLQCINSKKGRAAILKQSYFSTPVNGIDFPPEFTTGCTGDCLCGNNEECAAVAGWKFSAFSASSGYNNLRKVDVFLNLSVNMINNGSITFSYTVNANEENGILFFINNKQQEPLDYHPTDNFGTTATFPATKGETVFRWIYHQELGTTGSAQINNIYIEGSGGAIEDSKAPKGEYSEGKSGSSYFLQCSPGEYKDSIGRDPCEVCADDFYSPVYGASKCFPCGNNTKSSNSHTSCEMDLVIDFYPQQFNFTNLRNIRGPIRVLDSPDEVLWFSAVEESSFGSSCFDSNGEGIEGYLCVANERGVGKLVGNEISVQLVHLGPDTFDTAVLLRYTIAGRSDIEFSSILIVCSANITESLPFFVDGPDKDSEGFHMQWNTAYGCPTCLESLATVTSRSTCVNGVRTISTSYRGNCGVHELNGMIKTESCPMPIEFTIFQVLLISFIIGILVFCLIVLLIIAVCCHLDLRQQYSALSQKSSSEYEMDEIENEENIQPTISVDIE